MRILLVDDHRVLLAGLAALLRGQDWIAAIDTATTGAEALASAKEHPPDLAVVDLGLGPESGLELITRLREAVPAIKILVLTMSADPEDARAAVRAGAAGYVLKDSGPDEVLAALRLVASGGTALSAGAAPAVVIPGRAPAVRRLTDRERELLRLLARGRSTDEIARALFLSPKTIRNRLSELYAVLGVSNRAEAVAVAYELGL